MAQEWDALQGLSRLSQLTSLQLHKAARQLRGEAALGDGHLALAAALPALQRLVVGVCRLTDRGLASVAALTALRQLTLQVGSGCIAILV